MDVSFFLCCACSLVVVRELIHEVSVRWHGEVMISNVSGGAT